MKGSFRFTIQRKISTTFAILLLLTMAVFGMVYFMLASMEKASDDIVYEAFPIAGATNRLLVDLINEETGVRAYLVSGDEVFLEPYTLGKEQLQKDLETIRQYEDAHPVLKGLVENEALPQIEKIQNYFEEQITLVQNGNIEEARKRIGDGKEAMDAFRQVFAKIEADNAKLINDALNASRTASQRAKIGMLICGIGSVLLAILFALMLSKAIVKPIRQVGKQIAEIAEGEGDLTKEIVMTSRDEVGDLAASFNAMLRNLRSMIGQVGLTAQQVASSAEELTASADQTSSATEQIASTVQEVASATDRQVQSVSEGSTAIAALSREVESIAQRSTNVATVAKQGSQAATDGNQSIQTAVRQMGTISETIHDLSAVVKRLGQRSEEIGQIVDVIRDISAQTNLLALNAAIEAARAGEHGRGFAVVADEVRKLAEQSTRSAEQIAELIATIQMDTGKAVESMEGGLKEVEAGMVVVNEAGQSFEQIKRHIDEVSQQIEEVSSSIKEITKETSSVMETISQIAEVSEANAAGTQNVSAATEEQLAAMEEISSSAASLAKMAEELQSMIKKFKV
ncbi:methyl-accepting chemotaxis protein [Brevibacillus sp. SYP-B805]|uniref:methyl-accepting chemotaxis protein n=1 Tax=Brevibacillus sp. SYP-B805 TaxID=1578199 RepID=UPI0013EA9671|nr:methyl-accepting chemotaxis protein [Brevibacillus sp. SYP-B805]NGQ96768.1 methyl-accepting chemotaxis protein [Brevibacillus sp. SYP-B805]